MSNMHDLVAPYLLGSLGENEHNSFEAHLKECQRCREEVVELEPGLASLAAANAVTPPADLRKRVLSAVTGESTTPFEANTEAAARARNWWSRWLMPAAAILIVVVGAFAIFGTNPIDAVLDAPDATTVALAASDEFTGPPPSDAQVTFSASQQSAVLEFDTLVDPDGDNVYEAWLIGASGPIPAGTFTPDSDGAVVIKLDGTAQPGTVVAVTEEPAGGSPQPTGAPLFTAEL
jgi:anti-sigma-K factor RskA